ncbi:MAG: AAA family ATPase [Bacteroidota bacterium]|nr:AAA family ATPase [Bacteroidota bacterium]MDE2833331.1 AAA family ATPase [Bacteroidota bacterium]MDE2958278.1 AAA family ATPase [Bacteroidota bacterium]
MKINKLDLKNIRCFRELTLELNGESAVLVGDNGDGKSTVLRSLAMGLVDSSSASALHRELYGETVRRRSNHGRIRVDLESGGKIYRTETKITPIRDRFERVDQKVFEINRGEPADCDESAFPWEKIFATGYGAGIRVHGTEDYDYYLAADALYPLFVYDKRLQNPELVLRRLISSADGKNYPAEPLTKLTSLLTQLLQFKLRDKIDLTRTAIAITTDRGETPLTSAGDGYHSMVTWVLDLLSWWFLNASDGLTSVNGIVLIDEIEQHLHPRWQRNIVRLLTRSFKDVQFVISTHSPLVASGCEGIPVHRLNDQEHQVVRPFGWRAEDVYEMMGMASSRAEEFVVLLEKFQELDEKRLRNGGLTGADKSTFEDLYSRLEGMPGADPVRLVNTLENIARYARNASTENV